MTAARRNAQRTRGEVYNLGGGPERSVSVIEMLRLIERRTKQKLKLDYKTIRPGDQPWYVQEPPSCGAIPAGYRDEVSSRRSMRFIRFGRETS